MRTRHRTLSEHDRAVWAGYIRHVAPLPGVVAPETPPNPPPGPPPPEPQADLAARLLLVPRTAAPRLPPLVVGMQPPGVDSATWNRFRTSRVPAVRTLDLHGRTAQRAFAALRTFLASAHVDRVRCVEVVTGRGSGETGGVIRRELPLWLNLAELRPLVLAAAHPHAANPGSVRLLLRRVRP